MEHVEILVAGGGIAGLSAAALLAAEGREVMLVDPAPAAPPTGGGDLRTTAFLRPAMATLGRASVWQTMANEGAPLATMRIVDAGGRVRKPRLTADFEDGGRAGEPLGWNVPNRVARRALMARLAEMPNVRLHHGAGVTGCLPRLDAALCRLADGTAVAAKLVVGADGRNSTLRRLAGIGHHRWAYGQKALVFAVTHGAPHENVSTEIHRTGGPLTLVPMPDHEGRSCSSVVWMVPGARASELGALDDAALATELTAETMGLFGPLRLASPRAIWPIIAQAAHRLVGDRLVLIAEAAHVVPPIGAQGLNMSLADIESLAGVTASADDPGDPACLARHQRRQFPQMLARIAGIDLLNRAARTETQALRDLRALGLRTISGLPPLRRAAIRAGLGG